MLEVIDKGSATESHPVPLLFVHGAWHAAWCWDEHFLDFFADKGFRAVAVSLRGHGASTLSKPLNSVTFAGHVDSSMGLMMSHNETAPAAETSYAALAGCTTGGDGIGAAWVVGSASCMLDTFSAPSDGMIVA